MELMILRRADRPRRDGWRPVARGTDRDAAAVVCQRRVLHALADWDGDELVRWAGRAVEHAAPGSPVAVEARAVVGLGHAARGEPDASVLQETIRDAQDDVARLARHADDLLVQFTTPLGDGVVVATITLADHGPRTVDLPADEETAEVADHPDLAAGFGAGTSDAGT